ncbi:MAG: transposase [Bacteroidales bacterium]|nr:transposase [Bacteroidales bacterium]
MKKSRKKHTAAFKAQVAIEAIKEQETLSDLAKRFEIHPQMISNWKREFLSMGLRFSRRRHQTRRRKNGRRPCMKRSAAWRSRWIFARGPQSNWGS